MRATRQAWITALSWAPDGRHLFYLAGQPTASAGPVILDTAARQTTVAPPARMPLSMKTGVMCTPQAAVWLGGSAVRGPVRVCRHRRRGAADLRREHGGHRGQDAGGDPPDRLRGRGADREAAGSEDLISYCGVYLDDRGKISSQPAGLTAAALSG